MIDDLAFNRVVKKPVDGQITAVGVFFFVAVDVVSFEQQVFGFFLEFIEGVRAKGGRFDNFTAGEKDVRQQKSASPNGSCENRLHFLGFSRSGHIEIFWGTAQKQNRERSRPPGKLYGLSRATA